MNKKIGKSEITRLNEIRKTAALLQSLIEDVRDYHNDICQALDCEIYNMTKDGSLEGTHYTVHILETACENIEMLNAGTNKR